MAKIAAIVVLRADLFSSFYVGSSLNKFLVLNDFVWSDLRFGKWYHATQQSKLFDPKYLQL